MSKKLAKAVKRAIVEAKPKALLKLNLGAGKSKMDGYLSVDSIPFDGLDVVADLTKKWPWPDNSVSDVRMSHVLEHFTAQERIHVFNEMYRVLVDEGKANIITPHWSSNRAYGDLTHCFAQGTEILAESGWKPIEQVAIGELVMALDLETEESSLVPTISVTDIPYTGEMVHFETECMDLMVTPNHDMVWRSKGNGPDYDRPKLRKSQADTFLAMAGHHPRKGLSTINWVGESPKTVTIAEDEYVRGHHIRGTFDAADFAELAGWYVSEGNVDTSSSGHYRIQIAQSASANPEKYEKIVALLTRMGLKPTLYKDRIRFNSKILCKYFGESGLCFEKSAPQVIKNWSPDLLQRFLESAIAGDGRKSGDGWEYASTSCALANDIQEIALKAGYRSNIRIERRSEMKRAINGRSIPAPRDMYMVGISKGRDIWYPIPSKVQYTGRMVCVTLASKNNIYVRRNGKALWAGNCWPPVSEMFYLYLWKEWRKANAPHLDSEFNPKGFTCDFGTAGTGYGMHTGIMPFNEERRNYAMQWYKEACADYHVNIVAMRK